jgi:hypothetical protein
MPPNAAGPDHRARPGANDANVKSMKKLISLCVVTLSLVGLGAGCRSSASVRTAHHGVGVGAGVR